MKQAPGENLNQYLSRRLRSLIRWHTQIAKETKIGRTTLWRIASGNGNPRWDNIEKLLAWIEDYDKAPREKPRRIRSSAAQAKEKRGAAS